MNDQNILDAVVRVEVTDEAIIPGRSGTNDRGPWVIPPKHPCYIHQGDRYPVRIELPVPEHGRPRPGFYFLAGNPFKVSVVRERIVVSFDDRAVLLLPVEDVIAGLSKPALKAAS